MNDFLMKNIAADQEALPLRGKLSELLDMAVKTVVMDMIDGAQLRDKDADGAVEMHKKVTSPDGYSVAISYWATPVP